MFIRNAVITLASVAGVLAADGGFGEDVFWIVSHGPLTATRLDPIVSPGAISGHVHAIVGGSNFGPTYDYDHSMESACTTANIDIDHSNYWVPQLYNKNSNGSYSLAGLSYVNTYYQMRRTGDEPVYEFPPGFRMLAGDPTRRAFDESDPAQDAIRYLCLGTNLAESHEFPAARCPDGMRAQIYFPHCWDGINNWLEGSKHVAYGEGRFDGGGQCPPTHPKRIMGLFYEFIFHDHADYVPGGRVWANGDDVGYSLHGDFTNGWPVNFFSEIFSHGRDCSVGFGLDTCPALAPHVVKNQQCQYKGVKVVEDIGDQGSIPKLPGNNPVAAAYQEDAKFNSGFPSPTSDAVIPASSIIMGTVKGDAPQSAPPDAVPQTALTSLTTQSVAATTSTASSTNPVASSSRVGTPSRASQSTGSETLITSSPGPLDVPSQIGGASAHASATALPGGGGALVGVGSDVASDAVYFTTDGSSVGPLPSISSANHSSIDSTSGVPAPTTSVSTAARPAKSCGRRRKRSRLRPTY